MKKIVALLLISICFLPIFAEGKSIELQERKAEENRRSLSYVPTITYDGNLLCIYSNIPLENLQIIVTELSNGATFYFNNITVVCGQPYTLELPNAGAGNYEIDLNIGEKSYYGYFEVTP